MKLFGECNYILIQHCERIMFLKTVCNLHGRPTQFYLTPFGNVLIGVKRSFSIQSRLKPFDVCSKDSKNHTLPYSILHETWSNNDFFATISETCFASTSLIPVVLSFLSCPPFQSHQVNPFHLNGLQFHKIVYEQLEGLPRPLCGEENTIFLFPFLAVSCCSFYFILDSCFLLPFPPPKGNFSILNTKHDLQLS